MNLAVPSSGIVLVDYGDMPKTLSGEGFSLAIEYDPEEDGRWRSA